MRNTLLSIVQPIFCCFIAILFLISLTNIKTIFAVETTPPEEVSASCINQPVPLEAYVNPDYFYTRYKSSMSYQIPVEETGCTPGDPYSSCPTITGSAIGDDYNWECNVPAHVDIVDDDTIIQRSGGSFTYEFHKGDTISIYQDTVWGGVDCADGKKAMYRINPTSDPSQRGGGVWRQQMACGEVFSTEPQKLVTYYYDPAIDEPGNEEMPLTQCYLPPYDQLTLSGTTQMVYEGPALCCDKEINAAVVRSVTGPGAGETFVYCLGYGLCAHYERINFSLHNPSEWGLDTDLCRLETNKADYYLYPIKGVLSNNPEEFKSDLVAQGYEAHCMTPKINLHGEVNLKDEVKQLIDSGLMIEVHSEQLFNYKSVDIPLLRDPQSDPSIFDSLETYWGLQLGDQEDVDRETELINSGPVYSMTTLLQQCEATIDMLATIERMCQKLEDPPSCALDTDIPNTRFSTLHLLEAFRLDTDLNCKRIAQDDFYDEKGNVTDFEGKEIAEAISHTSLFIPDAYRIGFLVVVADLKETQNIPFFNFMRMPGKNADPQHEVRVLAFRIPDTATNKDRDSDIYYDDALQLMRDGIRTKQYKDQLIKKEQELKSSFSLPGSPGDIINCFESEFCQNNQYVMALVDFINSRLQNANQCMATVKNLPFEETTQITDSGGFVPKTAGATFNFENEQGDLQEKLKQENIVQSLGGSASSATSSSQSKLDFKFLSQFWPKNDPQDTNTVIRSFLVLPQGIEIEEIEKTIAGVIYSKPDVEFLLNTPYEDMDKRPDLKHEKYLKLSDTGQRFPEAKQELTTNIILDQDCVQSLTPDESIDKCKEKITARVISQDDQGNQDDNQTDREPRILGGRLGFLTRKLQQSMHNISSKAFKYIVSCKTTEDFLLGKCDSDVDNIDYDYIYRDTTDTGHYCIDWKLEWPETDLEQLKANIVSYMTTNTRVTDFRYTPERPWDDGYQFLQSTNPDVFVPASNLTNYFENWVNGGRSKLFFKMPPSIDQCGGDVCWRYIMNTCANAGFNPALCISMNLSETAGSNTRYDDNADFGCMIRPFSNVSANLDCLINRFFTRPHVFPKNFNGMWTEFAGLDTASPSYQKVKEYYQEISGGIGYKDGLCNTSP